MTGCRPHPPLAVSPVPILLTINDFVIRSFFCFLKTVLSHPVPTASFSPAGSGIPRLQRKCRLRWRGLPVCLLRLRSPKAEHPEGSAARDLPRSPPVCIRLPQGSWRRWAVSPFSPASGADGTAQTYLLPSRGGHLFQQQCPTGQKAECKGSILSDRGSSGTIHSRSLSKWRSWA